VRNRFGTPDEAIFQGRTNDNIELLKAWAGTTLAYGIFITGSQNIIRNVGGLLQNLLIAALVCGLGFVLHELAHRIVARRFGAQAHFVANTQMLLLSLVVALIPFGFFFAAPGAVWHRGYLTDRQGGLIALAGPATNLALSVLFLVTFPFVLLALQPQDQQTLRLLVTLFATGVGLNAFLGLFNMIPAGPFDGAKVLAWSPLYFGVTVVIGLLLTFVVSRNVDVVWGSMLDVLGV